MHCHWPPRKKTKRDSKWQDDWTRYNMNQSEKGFHLFSATFVADFSVASGGVHKIKQHMDTKKHSDAQ